VPRWARPGAARPRIDSSNGEATILRLTADAPSAGYRFWNLDVRLPPSRTGQGILFTYNDKRHVDVCNVRFEGSALHVNVDPHGTGTAEDSGIRIRGCQFHGANFSAFYGGSSGLVIDGNTFENNGLGATMFMHSVYLNGIAPGIHRPRITNNDFRTDARCGGVMLVLHERIADALVENNRFATTSTQRPCYGIQSAGSWAGASVLRATYRRNRIFMGHAGVGLEASACTDCVVTDNLVVRGGVAIGTTVNQNTPPTTGTIVAHNTLFEAPLRVGGQSSGTVLENNAVFVDAGSCWELGGAAVSRQAGNYCRTAGGVGPERVFVDPGRGDYRPVADGPLAGGPDRRSSSPAGMADAAWSPLDPGSPRRPPVYAGAFVR
jgi:hypothetical protein